MAGFVEQMARDNGVAQSLWMTLGFTDGNAIYAVRYASDGDAPTLFHTDDTEHLYRLNKCLRGAYSGGETRLIVSEPIGSTAEKWTEIPQNTAVTFDAGRKPSRDPFTPRMPTLNLGLRTPGCYKPVLDRTWSILDDQTDLQLFFRAGRVAGARFSKRRGSALVAGHDTGSAFSNIRIAARPF